MVIEYRFLVTSCFASQPKRPGTFPRRAVCAQPLSQELAPLARACWKRLQEGWAQQGLSGHGEQPPVENVMVCQLQGTPQTQHLGPWERHREHLQRRRHRFPIRTAHPARGSGLAVAHTRLQGQNPKDSSGNQITPQISWGQVYQNQWCLFAVGDE